MEAPESLSIKEIALHLSDTGKPIRSTELSQLSDLKAEEVAILKKAWLSAPPKRRRQIAERLVELAEDNVELNFDAIFRSLLTDEDAGVRSTAIKGLWESEDACLISPFIKMLEQDSVAEVQTAAAAALGKFAMLAECDKLRPVYTELISQTLLNTINNKTKPIEVRRRALEAIAPLSLPAVTKAIRAAYESGDAKLKASAIYAMGKNCDTRWLPWLLKEISSTDAETRYEAASALGELGEEEAVPHLAKLLGDSDSDVRLAVVQSLGQIGGNMARNYLKHCLNSESEAVREMAEAALEEMEMEEGRLDLP